jgi:predicted nucleic acid-binding protein
VIEIGGSRCIVVVKWFANENYSKEALLLKEAYVKGLENLSAPCILPFEVLNALKTPITWAKRS